MEPGLRARYPVEVDGGIDSPKVLNKKRSEWVQLPEWAKDNEYIQSGFRPISSSYLDCLKSCLYVHNETGNIYSHLLATVWMWSLPASFYFFTKSHYPDADADDWIIFSL